jgi:hypothetical protein
MTCPWKILSNYLACWRKSPRVITQRLIRNKIGRISLPPSSVDQEAPAPLRESGQTPSPSSCFEASPTPLLSLALRKRPFIVNIRTCIMILRDTRHAPLFGHAPSRSNARRRGRCSSFLQNSSNWNSLHSVTRKE